MIHSAVLVRTQPASASIDERFQSEARRTYLVEADFADDEISVRDNFGAAVVPPLRLFGPHPSNAFLRCKNLSAEAQQKMASEDATSTRMQWICTASFGFMNPFEVSESGDPADCPIEVVIEGVTEQQIADEDVDGNPIVTSAGVPFDPAVMKDRQRRIVKVSRYERGLTLAALFGEEAVVNAEPFQGLPAGTFKMVPPRATPDYRMGLNVTRYKVERVYEFNPDGWNAKPIDAGFMSLDPSTGKLVTLLDRDGLPLNEPALLDGNGQPLPLPPNKDDIVFHNFKIYRDADFEQFGYPSNLFVEAGF